MFWKGKKKEKIEGAGGPEKGIAYFGSFVATEKFCRDKVSLALGHDRVWSGREALCRDTSIVSG